MTNSNAEGRAKVALEALLFSSPQPLTVAEAGRILDMSEEPIRQHLAALQSEYQGQERAFQLVEVAGGFQLCTKPEFADLIQERGRPTRSSSLSQAALETLSIIAYKQPLTRADVEAIRGVRVDSAINSLVERELIAEQGRLDAPGRPILYGTTEAFLLHFGLNDIADLPPLPEGTPSNAMPISVDRVAASPDNQSDS